MSGSRNLFAFTEPGTGYPGYVSVNYPFDGAGGGEFTSTEKIEITVRSQPTNGECGSTSMVALDHKTARELGLALIHATN